VIRERRERPVAIRGKKLGGKKSFSAAPAKRFLCGATGERKTGEAESCPTDILR